MQNHRALSQLFVPVASAVTGIVTLRSVLDVGFPVLVTQFRYIAGGGMLITAELLAEGAMQTEAPDRARPGRWKLTGSSAGATPSHQRCLRIARRASSRR